MLLLDRLDGGSVRYRDFDVTNERGSWTAGARAGLRVGYVSQTVDLWPHLTVFQNLLLVLRYARGHPRGLSAEYKALDLLERFSIGDKSSSFPDQLSVGERQRVALARAVASDPQVLVLDEVTSNLDGEASQQVFTCLKSLTNLGVTLVFASHAQSIPDYLFPVTVSYGSVPGWGP